MSAPELDRAKFEAFLESLGESTFPLVRGRWTLSCPIATFLRSEGPYAVGTTTFGDDAAGERDFYPLPKWAQEFVAEFDKVNVRGVTGADVALRILRGIKP